MKDDLIWWSQHHVVHKMNALRHHHHVELMVWTCAERCISTYATCAHTQMQSYALVSFAANICTFKWSIMHLYASILHQCNGSHQVELKMHHYTTVPSLHNTTSTPHTPTLHHTLHL
jgi:hypothetical protein